jgi:hypothetical protein
MQLRFPTWSALLSTFIFLASGCADDANEAVERGVGAACNDDDDCRQDDQSCLNFKGGYCGIENCDADDDCPNGSACVTHDDGVNYCFLLCRDKPECNRHRGTEESNCVSSITFVDRSRNGKACEPPSG